VKGRVPGTKRLLRRLLPPHNDMRDSVIASERLPQVLSGASSVAIVPACHVETMASAPRRYIAGGSSRADPIIVVCSHLSDGSEI
jgi:hypothetical protein